MINPEMAALRLSYAQSSLSEDEIEKNPLHQFNKWFDEALKAEVSEANAMVLSTVSKEHKAASRIVLLKSISKDGPIFFTNYNSHKANDIAHNPHVSILFFWKELERQLRIQGRIEKIPASASDEYFYSRPKESQLGAIASQQSKPIASREALDAKFAQLQHIEEIKRPDHWGGYIVKPTSYEFWQGRTNRLHDRLVYTQENEKWIVTRLQP